ncbi:hypothetical protein HYC85_009532 [Camellia sinensis]|uniref:Ubiquitin-like domain-containing protein n=1 Tax=Camellia sinensis TaxID=4442 RepID=A0A7J7HHX0_CAMSI|nr:hypothetical protein HYC85_009532 [Camellia sinensis]
MGAESETTESSLGVGSGEEVVTLNIRCSNGSKFSVRTSLQATVEAFKALLVQNCDVPADQQRLICKGRILKDDQILASHGSLSSLSLSLYIYIYICTFESEAVMSRFHGVYDKLNQALDDMPYEKLGISEEVKEQVELMCMQLKRAKRRTDTQDIELAMDMMVVFSENDDRNADNAILERRAIKLELHTIADLKTETIAVRKLVNKKGAHTVDSTKKIVDLLEKFIHIAGIEEISVLDNPVSRSLEKCRSLLIPNEFLCPITLEIMTDPVIVATGQVKIDLFFFKFGTSLI